MSVIGERISRIKMRITQLETEHGTFSGGIKINRLIVLIICAVLFAGFMFVITSDQKESIEEQEKVCKNANGDLISTSVPVGSRCLINGEEIRFVETVNGWKLKHDAYVLEGGK